MNELNLMDLAKSLNGEGGIPFMENREKKELPCGSPVTIVDYGFIKDEDGDYVVLALKEFPKNFYFGGGVVTEKMQSLDKIVTTELSIHDQVCKAGLPVLFTKKANKKNTRNYMTCEFYPVELPDGTF